MEQPVDAADHAAEAIAEVLDVHRDHGPAVVAERRVPRAIAGLLRGREVPLALVLQHDLLLLVAQVPRPRTARARAHLQPGFGESGVDERQAQQRLRARVGPLPDQLQRLAPGDDAAGLPMVADQRPQRRRRLPGLLAPVERGVRTPDQLIAERDQLVERKHPHQVEIGPARTRDLQPVDVDHLAVLDDDGVRDEPRNPIRRRRGLGTADMQRAGAVEPRRQRQPPQMGRRRVAEPHVGALLLQRVQQAEQIGVDGGEAAALRRCASFGRPCVGGRQAVETPPDALDVARSQPVRRDAEGQSPRPREDAGAELLGERTGSAHIRHPRRRRRRPRLRAVVLCTARRVVAPTAEPVQDPAHPRAMTPWEMWEHARFPTVSAESSQRGRRRAPGGGHPTHTGHTVLVQTMSRNRRDTGARE